MEARAIISTDTGEVLRELHDGDRIIRNTSLNYLNNSKKSDLKGRRFVRVDSSEGLKLLNELNAHERSVLFVLQYYVAYESGLIQFPNGNEIGFEDICMLTGYSREKTSTVLSSLIKKDIIYKGKNSRKVQYYMNPWVASKGVIVNPTLKEMFKNYRIRSKDCIPWKDLRDG